MVCEPGEYSTGDVYYQYFFTVCGERKERKEFHDGCINRGVKYCKRCFNSKTMASRRKWQDHAARCLDLLRRDCKKQGLGRLMFGVRDVRSLLKWWQQNDDILSSSNGPSRLIVWKKSHHESQAGVFLDEVIPVPAMEARKLKPIGIEYRATAISIDRSTYIDNLIQKYRHEMIHTN